MLSTNPPSGAQRRRILHRRQASTPAAFEALDIRPLPAHSQTRRHNRTGMSLDLRSLNLDSLHEPHTKQPQSSCLPPPSFLQEKKTVSITNLGQPTQHAMQVAQPHSQPQPGPLNSLRPSPIQTSLPSPRTPRQGFRAQSPQQPPLSPSKPPTEQQLKDLHQHIQSVYGSCGQVFINILPTPTTNQHEAVQLSSQKPLITAPLDANFASVGDINLAPTPGAMTFDFEHPDIDMGYESSSYYTSDALSPSPMSSPRQKSVQSFLQGIEEHPSEDALFSHAAPILAPSEDFASLDGLSFHTQAFQPSALFNEVELDASLEYTGIAPEEVQRYISEQDTNTGKWTCLYQDCGKMFGRRENIRSHVQTHLGDRQYKCNGCGKCFVRQHDLKRHAKIHSGNKPYKCPCGAGFARQDALTRHRQRGMCVGGFPDAVRRQAKRGRPRKHRPDLEQRIDKANRSRRALASAPSSVSAGSPRSDTRASSPIDVQEPSLTQLSDLSSATKTFDDTIISASDPFSFANSSSSFVDARPIVTASFETTTSYATDTASLNVLEQLAHESHTPPLSPLNQQRHPTDLMDSTEEHNQSISNKRSCTPSRSSVLSNPFTTPPTSPAQPRDDFEELFEALPENSCSQFDMEMKAMDDFTSIDSSSYDFLDFNV